MSLWNDSFIVCHTQYMPLQIQSADERVNERRFSNENEPVKEHYNANGHQIAARPRHSWRSIRGFKLLRGPNNTSKMLPGLQHPSEAILPGRPVVIDRRRRNR
jgi:hypothetical protein